MKNRFGIFSGTDLKLIACIAMAIDHAGLVLFPGDTPWRAIGRLAFPLFAFFIAEGCRYTRDRIKHFLLIFGVGAFYFVFYYLAYGNPYPSVFLTFSVSVLIIYLTDAMKSFCLKGRYRLCKLLISLAAVASALAVSYMLFGLVDFDYGFFGMLAPVVANLFVFRGENAPRVFRYLSSLPVRVVLMGLSLIPVCMDNRHGDFYVFGIPIPVQYLCLLALPLLMLYNERVGNKKLKYFFYIFYPAHLVVIEGISLLLVYLG